MITLLKLLLAHLVGDFLLQPTSWVKDKEKHKLKSDKLYLHIAIHGILILILLWDLSYWLLAVSIAAIHGGIDLVKLYTQKTTNKTTWFIIDQLLHVISIILLVTIWSKYEIHIPVAIDYPAVWLYLTATVFVTAASSILIQVLMQNWSQALNLNGKESLNNAGKYIGILERLLIFTFILTNHWEAIGFLLAAKSVFRFGDLTASKDRKLTEYILIGTLLSFGIAIFTGMTVKYLSALLSC